MENPFSVLEKKLSGIERITLELYNHLQAKTGKGLESEKPLNAQCAAEFLGIPKNTLYALTSRRDIVHYKKGKQLFFLEKDLLAWLKAGRQKTVAEIQAESIKGLRNA